MTTKKKLIIALIFLCIVLVVAIAGTTVVFVATSASAKTNVNVEFVANRVQCTLRGSYTNNGTTTNLKKGTQTTLTFGPNVQNDSFDSTDIISLEEDSPKVVFEYIFTNTDDEINMNVELLSAPDETNVKVGYAYSATQLDKNNITTTTNYEIQQVNAGQTKYLYIVVEVDDLMGYARYAGSIQWGLSRA